MLTRLGTRMSDERGITLVELLVVMLLMGVIGSVATTGLVRGMQVSAATQTRFDALADLQKSVDRMTAELRAAEAEEVGGAPLVVAEPDRVVVNVFSNEFSEHRRYTYRYCATEQRIHALVEGPSPAPSGTPPTITCATTTAPVLIDGVTNPAGTPVFEYRTAAGAVTSVASQARTVHVTVRRSLDGQPNPIEVKTMVRLRNAR